MRHNREQVVQRAAREFDLLDHLVGNLTDEEWSRPVPRPESRDPWTVKDTLAHITHWKADVARVVRRQRKPAEERGLNINAGNQLVYLRWRDRSPQEVLAWHRQVQADVLAALQEAPDEWFSGRERGPDWPGDLVGHSAHHRVKDIERALDPACAPAIYQVFIAEVKKEGRFAFVAIPFSPREVWGARPRYPVSGTIDDIAVRGTLGASGTSYFLRLAAVWLRSASIEPGAMVTVRLSPEE